MTENVHALTGAYALDALDATERAAFEAHLPACPDCRAEVASLLEAAGRLGSASATTPPPGLLEAVRDELDRTAQVAPAGPSPARAVERRTPARPRAWVLAAAAVAAVAVGAVGLRVATGRVDPAAEAHAEVVRIMAAPDMVSHDLGLGSSHLVMSEDMGAAAVMGSDVPDPSEGSVYQVWMMHADGSMAAGPTFVPDDGAVTSVVEGDLSAVTAFMVTQEPPGGSRHPSGAYLAELHL